LDRKELCNDQPLAARSSMIIENGKEGDSNGSDDVSLWPRWAR
jgi:hypothetical protein